MEDTRGYRTHPRVVAIDVVLGVTPVAVLVHVASEVSPVILYNSLMAVRVAPVNRAPSFVTVTPLDPRGGGITKRRPAVRYALLCLEVALAIVHIEDSDTFVHLTDAAAV